MHYHYAIPAGGETLIVFWREGSEKWGAGVSGGQGCQGYQLAHRPGRR